MNGNMALVKVSVYHFRHIAAYFSLIARRVDTVLIEGFFSNKHVHRRTLRIGTSIRVNKQSFDNWFAAV